MTSFVILFPFEPRYQFSQLLTLHIFGPPDILWIQVQQHHKKKEHIAPRLKYCEIFVSESDSL